MIDGLIVSARKHIAHPLGDIFHAMKASDPEFAGFGEMYFSEVQPGAVKAWKKHSRMRCSLVAPVGKVKIVAYDLRDDSPTKGNILELETGRDNYSLISIPPGVWFGFANFSDAPALLANCASIEHDPTEAENLPFDTSEIPYSWKGQG
jgi:dTDP-4-dehydrorhamnose 3,5-epimerase